MYYSTWEKLGVEKRDILKDRAEDAKDAQEDASGDLRDALTRLQEAYPVKETELAKVYSRLKDSYENSESSSSNLKSRIDKMHSVATDLFEEWKEEADSINTASLKAQSLRQLDQAKGRYSTMRQELLESYDRTGPVLRIFKDYVLFVKHNLNAQSLGSLSGESKKIQSDIEQLINQMQRSIGETERFIRALEG